MRSKPYLYRDFIKTLSERFLANISYIQGIYGFDYGDEFEIAICKTIRSALPHKYGICRGHIVDAEGNQAGDDIVIYDRLLFPTLRLLPEEDYSRKEWIPVEAVYAYIEAKHTLLLHGNEEEPSSLRHACKQMLAVKSLCSKRKPVSRSEIVPGITFREGTINFPDWVPAIRNPLYGLIISRFVRKTKEEPVLNDPEQIKQDTAIGELFEKFLPDAIVLGASNLILPIDRDPVVTGNLFHLFFNANCEYAVMSNPDVAYGAALCLLLSALDFIRLGSLPWNDIVSDAIIPYEILEKVREMVNQSSAENVQNTVPNPSDLSTE